MRGAPPLPAAAAPAALGVVATARQSRWRALLKLAPLNRMIYVLIQYWVKVRKPLDRVGQLATLDARARARAQTAPLPT